MAEVVGDEVNAVLRMVEGICPGEDAKAGDRQLTLLVAALCVATRSCGADIDKAIALIEFIYAQTETAKLKPLKETVQ